jgi:hypothetical protein
VTQLKEPLLFENEDKQQEFDESEIETWSSHAETGMEYPFSAVPVVEDDLKFRSKKGGVISKRIPGGEVFARGHAKAEDPEKGKDADCLINAIRDLQAKGKNIWVWLFCIFKNCLVILSSFHSGSRNNHLIILNLLRLSCGS